MPDYSSRFGQAASGAASGASIGLALSPYTAGLSLPIGAGLGLLSGLFEESDKEIRQRQVRQYLERLAQLRGKSLEKLSAETQKNFGRINQRTTGLIQRGSADAARRAAGAGRTADEADMLAIQGNVTGQGSELIKYTQDESERQRRRLEDYYDNLALQAESEGIFAPEEPGITDVLGSLAPAALQFAFNKDLLGNQPNRMTAPNVNVDTRNALGITNEIPADFTVEDEPMQELARTRRDRITPRTYSNPYFRF